VGDLAAAETVVGVGLGVDVQEYSLLDPLLHAVGGQLAATRQVTDRGWLPRSRQVGVTGHNISPRLYVGIGCSGKWNHMVGVRTAGFVLAINHDPQAEIFRSADVGIVADWRLAVASLVDDYKQRFAD
jgi:electron transfer flavoprotein alpha subunit